MEPREDEMIAGSENELIEGSEDEMIEGEEDEMDDMPCREKSVIITKVLGRYVQKRPLSARNFISENRSLTKKAPIKSLTRPPSTGKVYPEKKPPNLEQSPLKIKKELIPNHDILYPLRIKKELIPNESPAITEDKFYCKIRNNKPVAIKVSPFESKRLNREIQEDLFERLLNNSNGVSDQDLAEITDRNESKNEILDDQVKEMADEIDNLHKELGEWKSQINQYKMENEALLNQNSRLILEHSNQRMENDVLVKILEKKDLEIEQVHGSMVTNLAHKEAHIHILKTQNDELSNKVKALEPFKEKNEKPEASFDDLGYVFLQENIFKDENKTEEFVNKLKGGKKFVTKTWKNGFGVHGISKSLKDFESVLDGEETKETFEERGTFRTIIALTCKQIPGLTIKIGCRVTGFAMSMGAKILGNIGK